MENLIFWITYSSGALIFLSLIWSVAFPNWRLWPAPKGIKSFGFWWIWFHTTVISIGIIWRIALDIFAIDYSPFCFLLEFPLR